MRRIYPRSLDSDHEDRCRGGLWLLYLIIILQIGCPATAPTSSVAASKGEATGDSPASEARRRLHKLQGATMGTTYHISLVRDRRALAGNNGTVPIKSKIDAALARVNQQMSTYIADSELMLLNGASADKPHKVGKELARLMTRAISIGKKTQNAFDMTVGPVVNLFGFGNDGRRTEIPPDLSAKVEALRPAVGPEAFSLKGDYVTKRDGRTEFDLSAIAKGYGVDVVATLLLDNGIKDFLVEIGGEVAAYGTNLEGKPWRVGINLPSPTAGATTAIRRVELKNMGLATSGDYRNGYKSNGRSIHHIFDPRTLRSTASSLASVSVVAPDVALADALATSAMVLGEETMRKVVAKSYPQVELLFIHRSDKEPGDGNSNGFTVTQTEGFPLL